jgi:DHA2 family multidrug resistance protein
MEHLTPFSRNLQEAIPQISQFLRERGLISPYPRQGSLGLIYNQLLQQASMLAFNDTFYTLSVMMILILPFVLLMKKAKETRPPMGVH